MTKAPAFTAEQSEALATFINDNAGTYTYAEIAEKFPGEFTAKQIQGKCLALELTDKVRPAEKVEVARIIRQNRKSSLLQWQMAVHLLRTLQLP